MYFLNYFRNHQVKFFCLQVLEHYLKSAYSKNSSKEDFIIIQNQILSWFQNQNGHQNPTFLRNKQAQIIALAFVTDYPSRWPSFFQDMLHTSNSSKAVDLYLKSLLAVHSEVVDRDIARTNAEMQRNTMIKDSMRMNTVPVLVNSWYEILRMDNVDSQIVCQCLDVIGSFISWIDIDLIANDRFVPIILQCLGDDLKRESACDCLREIVSKGMQPLNKLKLIDSLTTVLDNLGVFTTPPQGDDVIDFLAKLAKLLNTVGLEVLTAYTTLMKANDLDGAASALKSLEDKVLIY